MNVSRIPLAERVRPQTLNDIVGQQHLTGTDGVFRRMLETGTLSSMILWGPPGVGKTTLAFYSCSIRKASHLHIERNQFRC